MPFLQVVNLNEYYGLAIKLANEAHKRLLSAGVYEIERQELIQEGFRGLVEAGNRYDPEKGAAFGTFAYTRIYGAIIDYMRSMDPLTQREREKVKKLDRVKDELIRLLGREPLMKELAQALAIPEKNVRKIEALRVIMLSLDKPVQFGEGAEESATWEIPSVSPDAEKQLIMADTQGSLQEDANDCIENGLTDEERNILIFRVLDELSLEKVGQFVGMSLSTVSRREKQARTKMRQCLENKEWTVTDIMEILP